MNFMLILGVVLAVVANMVIGMLWYGPMLFGNTWAKLAGVKMDPNDPNFKKEMQRCMMFAPIIALTVALVMVCFMTRMNIHTIVSGALFGFTAWFGFIAPTMYNDVLYAKKPFNLYLINVGYVLASFVVMGAILAKFI